MSKYRGVNKAYRAVISLLEEIQYPYTHDILKDIKPLLPNTAAKLILRALNRVSRGEKYHNAVLSGDVLHGFNGETAPISKKMRRKHKKYLAWTLNQQEEVKAAKDALVAWQEGVWAARERGDIPPLPTLPSSQLMLWQSELSSSRDTERYLQAVERRDARHNQVVEKLVTAPPVKSRPVITLKRKRKIVMPTGARPHTATLT